MKSYRKNMRKNKKSRKNKKGGFFFGSKPTVAPSAECDPNNLVNIQANKSFIHFVFL